MYTDENIKRNNFSWFTFLFPAYFNIGNQKSQSALLQEVQT